MTAGHEESQQYRTLLDACGDCIAAQRELLTAMVDGGYSAQGLAGLGAALDQVEAAVAHIKEGLRQGPTSIVDVMGWSGRGFAGHIAHRIRRVVGHRAEVQPDTKLGRGLHLGCCLKTMGLRRADSPFP